MAHPGLDSDFLHYIQATPENQRRIQSIYLPFFTGCQEPVADLACGHGDFVQLLTEHGVEALGVDSDPVCCREARQRGINALCSDVFDYLEQVREESLGGVFCAHLVEHLAYQQVMELIQLSYQALKPGGVILLVTPNVGSLYTHLESFYMHFGHVTFYHPRLLSFFLDRCGFHDPRAGENPQMAHPLWHRFTSPDLGKVASGGNPEVDNSTYRPSLPRPVAYNPSLSSPLPGVLGRLIGAAKMLAVRLVVQPLLDRVVHDVNRSLRQMGANISATRQMLMALDRPVECYVYATKGDVVLDLPPELVGERL